MRKRQRGSLGPHLLLVLSIMGALFVIWIGALIALQPYSKPAVPPWRSDPLQEELLNDLRLMDDTTGQVWCQAPVPEERKGLSFEVTSCDRLGPPWRSDPLLEELQ